jgi:uncharacterized membrane protein
MNWAYLHLATNHFPIIGVILGTLILIVGVAINNQGVKASGLGTIVFAALMAVVAYMTGDPAEDAVKSIPEVAKSLVSRHEDIAAVGMYLLIPAGLMAALTLYSIWRKEKSVRFLIVITLVLSLVASGAMVYVGRTGGQIRHSEFRSNADTNYIIEHRSDVEDDD